MSKRTKVDIGRELPVSASRSTQDPLPREEQDPYLGLVVDVTIESLSYRELFLAALEKLGDTEKQLKNAQRTMRERARRDVHR